MSLFAYLFMSATIVSFTENVSDLTFLREAIDGGGAVRPSHIEMIAESGAKTSGFSELLYEASVQAAFGVSATPTACTA